MILNPKKLKEAFIIFTCIIGLAIQPNFLIAAENNFPKLYNHFIRWDVLPSQAEELANWDMVALDMEVQHTTPEIFNILRQKNPHIKILAYITSQEISTHSLPGHYLRYKLKNGIQDNWWLKDANGNRISQWPKTYLLNMHSGWSDYLANFVAREIVSTGLWDGIFYDNIWQNVSWVNNNIDINNDGLADRPIFIDAEWQAGVKKLLNKTRNLIGQDKIIIGNGNGKYYEYLNGKMFESFPTPWEGGIWQAVMNNYKQADQNFQSQSYIIIHSDTNNTGNNRDYKKVRFGLTSTLLGNGYFAFDFGTQDHSQLWWYDEYDINLGTPVGEVQNLLNNFSVQYEPGVWRRDYTRGLALVNSTQQAQTVDLDSGIYEKIRGTQDPQINNGQLVKKVTLPAEDGLILLRKIELDQDTQTNLKGITFSNGSYVRIFDKRGQVKRSGFYAYQPAFEGGAEIAIEDLNNDGTNETVAANKSKIQIFNSNGMLVNEFYPYGNSYSYNKGINIAVGNVQGDNKKEIVTGTKTGGGPQVRIFDYQGNLINKGWFAYDLRFRGGVQVALGDLNGNGYEEIVTGAGFGGGPHVRIFDATGHLFDPGFFSYDPRFRGGVNVTCADLNNDGKDEIITGAGPTGGPHVRIYDKIGHLVDPGFFAFDSASRSGVRVGAADVDADGVVEILGMSI